MACTSYAALKVCTCSTGLGEPNPLSLLNFGYWHGPGPIYLLAVSGNAALLMPER